MNSVQQQRTVKGIVIDANGEAVIGANVKEPGSTTGTITDMNGEFSLSVGPKATLEISFIGYTTQKVNVGASNTVKVILKEDTKVLDEVVITGFGMSQKKATLTGAVAAIASTDIERSNATTASGALVGKIAGINTRQNDGRPGASTQLQIRNMGAPLYVIDGVVSDDGQFNHMDFNDIESISILKDASAAIYGVRAANGVVVVTSKKGQRNSKNSVSINAYYGWQHNSRYVQPAKTKDYVNAYVSAETWAKKADNDRRYNKEEYAKWMDKVLTEHADKTWKVVTLHYPIFPNASTPGTQETIGSVLDKHNVQMVFCGHGHTYERVQVKNGEYLVPTSDRRTFTPVIGGTIHMQLGDMRGTGSNGRWFHCAVNGKEMVVTIRDANNEIKTDESFTLYAAELNDYTVNFNAIGNGTIAASSNNEAVSDGQALKECSDIVFTATPDEGYAIKNWIVNGETVESKETTYTIDGLKENTTVTVEFESLSGVDNVLDATLRVFPNPAGEATVISRGVYLFNITKDNATKTVKVIKK